MVLAYPLQWPDHTPRTPRSQICSSRFDVTQSVAQEDLIGEIRRLGGASVVLSTNIPLRRDGLPYASRRAPDDTGVAVYFTFKGKSRSFSCDRYWEVRENMRALGKTLEAMRGISRWDAHEVLDQMFHGFTALPPPDAMTTPPPMQKQWWEVLGVALDATMGVANAAYKALARKASESDLYELNEAIALARKVHNV